MTQPVRVASAHAKPTVDRPGSRDPPEVVGELDDRAVFEELEGKIKRGTKDRQLTPAARATIIPGP